MACSYHRSQLNQYCGSYIPVRFMESKCTRGGRKRKQKRGEEEGPRREKGGDPLGMDVGGPDDCSYEVISALFLDPYRDVYVTEDLTLLNGRVVGESWNLAAFRHLSHPFTLADSDAEVFEHAGRRYMACFKKNERIVYGTSEDRRRSIVRDATG